MGLSDIEKCHVSVKILLLLKSTLLVVWQVVAMQSTHQSSANENFKQRVRCSSIAPNRANKVWQTDWQTDRLTDEG